MGKIISACNTAVFSSSWVARFADTVIDMQGHVDPVTILGSAVGSLCLWLGHRLFLSLRPHQNAMESVMKGTSALTVNRPLWGLSSCSLLERVTELWNRHWALEGENVTADYTVDACAPRSSPGWARHTVWGTFLLLLPENLLINSVDGKRNSSGGTTFSNWHMCSKVN